MTEWKQQPLSAIPSYDFPGKRVGDSKSLGKEPKKVFSHTHKKLLSQFKFLPGAAGTWIDLEAGMPLVVGKLEREKKKEDWSKIQAAKDSQMILQGHLSETGMEPI